jgi:predicted GNAT family acetyltransferase
MKAVDAKPVWSIICFVVPSEFRGQGVATALLEGAVAFAKKQGATIVEAYPKEPTGKVADDSLWFGKKSMYEKAGFDEVARHTPARPVMRRALDRTPSPKKVAEPRKP